MGPMFALRPVVAAVALLLLVDCARPDDGKPPRAAGSATSTPATDRRLSESPGGEAAPVFTRKNLVTGEPMTIPVPGKVTLVYFWATWSAPDVKGLHALEEIHRRHVAEGLHVVGISMDDEDTAEANVVQTAKEQGVTFPVVRDGKHEILDRYRPASDPFIYLIDPDGRVRFFHGGYHDRDDALYEEEVIRALRPVGAGAGRPPRDRAR